MTEAEILHRLRPGSWVSKPERKALEAMLSQVRRVPSASPVVTYAPSQNHTSDGPAVEGSANFSRACEAALNELRAIPSWKWARYLRVIRESEDNISSSGGIAGYYDRSSGAFMAFPASWKGRRPKDFAATILHEMGHAAHPPTGDAAEDERIAMRIENQGRREMGFMFTFAPENNPTHHIQWEKDWNRKHAR